MRNFLLGVAAFFCLFGVVGALVGGPLAIYVNKRWPEDGPLKD